MRRRSICVFFVGWAMAATLAACASAEKARDGADEPRTAPRPMTDLHRYVRHGNFQPPWKELQTESLGDRLLLIDSLMVGHGTVFEMSIIADANRTKCRISLFRSNEWGVRGTILFEHGGVKPVGYTGAGACAAEPPAKHAAEVQSLDDQICAFHDGASISLHGLAWRGERETEKGAKSLSQRRAEYVREHLEGTALPQKVTGTEAHGTDRSDVEMPTDGPVPGVYLALHDPGISNADDPFLFHNHKGPPIPSNVRTNLDSFMESYGTRPDVPAMSFHGTSLSLSYVTPQGRTIEYYGEPFTGNRRALIAMYRWAQALTKAGCRYDKVRSFEAFLPKNERKE